MKEIKIPHMHKLTALALLLIGVVFAALQTLMVWKYYEADIYLYAHGTPLPDIFNISLAVYVVIALVLFRFFNKKDYPESEAPTSAVTLIFSALCGFAVLANGIFGFMSYMEASKNMAYIAARRDTFLLWGSLLAVFCFVYFMVSGFMPKAKKAKAWLGCTAIIWHILYLLYVYFDMTNPLNSPIRLMNEFALVAMMMFITVEVRYTLGIPKKGFYISTAVIAFTLLLCSAVSNIVCVISGRLSADVYFGGYVYELVAAGYVLTRLISQLGHSQTTELPKEEK